MAEQEVASFLPWRRNDEELIITYMAYVTLACAVMVTFKMALGAAAPYGRYASQKWGMLINANVAWVVQELPAFSVPLFCVLYTDGKQLSNPANVVCMAMVIVHYFQRPYTKKFLTSNMTEQEMASFLPWRRNDEELIITYMAYVTLACAVMVTFKMALWSAAPYGRYASKTWGMLINANVAWVVQELPAFSVPLFCVLYTDGKQLSNPTNVVCVAMVIVHYFQRTFIFGLLSRGKPTPISPFIAAIFFCLFNGYMQGRYQTQYAVHEKDYIWTPRFLIGCAMFVSGMAINIHSDVTLKNLRKPGETGYKIPRGGMFDYISGANFFGESLEWTGYAVACWNLPAFAFAAFTVGNIGPRAFHHHKFYKEKFEDYPPERKAFIPFLI